MDDEGLKIESIFIDEEGSVYFDESIERAKNEELEKEKK